MSTNDSRKNRVLELGSQTKLFLEEATRDYEDFQKEAATLNKKLAALYLAAGLAPPPLKSVEILKAQNVGNETMSSTVADVLEVIADVALFVSITKSLGPPATKYLTNTQKISDTFGERLLVEKSISLYEDALGASRGVAAAPETVDIAITGGEVAGHVVAGLLAGVAVGVLDGIIWVAEEEQLKSHLKKAIKSLHPLRTAMLLSKRHTAAARQSLQTVDTMVEALEGHDQAQLKKALDSPTAASKNIVVKSIEKILSTAVTPEDAATDLQRRDKINKSYTDDDPKYQT